MKKFRKLPSVYKWLFWGILLQLLLLNISAAFYAYRFTHFHSIDGGSMKQHKNIFTKTWRLFTGPKLYLLPTKETPSFPYQNVLLTLKNNTSIAAWYSKQEKAKGCVLLFHGYTAEKSFLIKEAAQFKQWGYNVFLVDFRGHGASGGHTTFGYKESEEVAAAFSYARERGNQKIILYGVSMGAVAIMKATAEKRVQPAALIADMPFGSLQDHYIARARNNSLPPQPFPFLVTFYTGVENRYNGFDNTPVIFAKKISCPVLLEWGARDQYVTRDEINTIYERLISKNKQLAIYPEANHESYLQKEPALWKNKVNQFLESL
ncbi:MAG: alpha/beta fold hydrolase [Chitinophagaceae bacterium]